jgi:hypothetical protein
VRSKYFAKASNTLMLFSCMLCKGVYYAGALISIYRVSWAFVAVGEWPLVLCHVSWDPPTFTWNSGQTDILQNVVVFLRILQNVVVFHHYLHLGSCGWMVRYTSGLLQMNVTWISGLYYEDCSCTTSRMIKLTWND